MYDKAGIRVKGGNGGDGAITFRREKFVPFGGPSGGNGGDGGNVVLLVDQGVSSLRLFKKNQIYRANNGSNGQSQNKKGRQGADLVLSVPVGTMVWKESGTGERILIADLKEPEQKAVIARGGRGGWGNAHFATSTNQTPVIAEKGETGEDTSVDLELRLIADVGIIGFPNVGKSSLLAAASKAKPKVANYPFTTLEPVLGVVEIGAHNFVVAEIPGLIEGAHAGRGLGFDFLRHALRTRVLIHLIDGTSASPMDDLVRVNTELRLFDGGLAGKPQIIAVNKIDLPEVQAKVREIRGAFNQDVLPVFFISAVTGEGVPALMQEAYHTLRQVSLLTAEKELEPEKIFRPVPEPNSPVATDGSIFVVNSKEIERVVTRVDLRDAEVMWQLRGLLDKMGISRDLEKAGIQAGDTIRCGPVHWQW